MDEIESFGKKLSKIKNSSVLAAALHDDSVLYLWLFQNDECRDFYDSLPQYFDSEAEPGPPEGGDSKMWCEAFGCSDKWDRVESILRANLLDGELPEIPGELERHQALIKMFGMPLFASFVTYSSIEGRYFPDEFKNVEFTSVG